MTIPLVLLALLSLGGGYVALYPKAFNGVFDLIPQAHGADHTTILLVSVAVLLIGAGAALLFYKSSEKDTLAAKSPPVFGGLSLLKFTTTTSQKCRTGLRSSSTFSTRCLSAA
jgi:NADH-quinone oxidoreductase subunit L